MNTKYVLGERIKPCDFLSFFNRETMSEQKLEVHEVLTHTDEEVLVTFKSEKTEGFGCTFQKRKKVRVLRP